jgi:hypothetical protein
LEQISKDRKNLSSYLDSLCCGGKGATEIVAKEEEETEE